MAGPSDTRRIQWSRRLSLAAACLAGMLVLACLASAFIPPPSPSSGSRRPPAARVPANAPAVPLRTPRRPLLRFCTSAQCQREGQRLNSSIAWNQNPCRDPYRYACGRAAHSQAADLRRGDERRLSALLSSTVAPRSRQTVTEKAAALYQGCLKTELLTAQSSDAWWAVAQRLGVSQFPLPLDREPPVAPELLAGHLLRHLGLGPLVALRLGTPPGNRSAVAIYVDPPSTAASWRWNETASGLQALTRRSPDGQVVRALVELDRAVAHTAAKASPPVAAYVPRYRTIRIFSLPQHAKWRWREVFSALLEDLAAPQTVSLVLTAPGYVEEAAPLLADARPAAVHNYLAWRLALELAPLLPVLPASVLLAADGVQQRPERRCLRELRGLMEHAATALLAPQPGPQGRTAARDVLAAATDQLKRQLVDYMWIAESVSQRAVQKLNALQAHLLYPPFVEDKMVLEQIYRQVPDVGGDNPVLLDWFRARSAVMLKRWKALAGKGLPPLWDVPYMEPAVHYFADSNELVVPVGVLREPIFSPPGNALPLDIARFGFQLARQLAQAVLYRGAFHDESGALSFWWERGSFVRLHHAEHCLARHHAADPAEAVLDQVALQAAYALYKQRQQGSPGLQLAALPHASDDQLFSLAFATVSAYAGASHWWKQNRVAEPLESRWR
ncbi:neprilysin-1-like [Dermacentor variabilis]|uniref:neprilysin-1-like n=1 Tax=Dermacentor variabilis TaxID=34621 RepID=UPI003F5C0CF8